MNDISASDTPLSDGFEIIRQYVRTLPSGPGVYRMLDKEGAALYVGKARNLKNRVTSYTSPSGLTTRILRMISLTASMEFITTKTEGEALLLEANLIKRLSPRYNILLRDDKSFPFILLTGDHAFAQVIKHRGAQNRKGKYFGPFASASAVNATVAFLQRAFLLRPCSDSIFKNRSRPCLQYQIKRCSAPCVGYISEAEYSGLVAQASDFLNGKSRAVQEQLFSQMRQASELMEYEKAAILRDRLRALTQVQNAQSQQLQSLPFADVIGLFREGGQCCIQVFFYRSGQNFGNKAYFPANTEGASDSEILCSFIGQFYQTQQPPKQVVLSHTVEEAESLAEALMIRAGGAVEIVVPQKGDKREAVLQVVRNAEESLRRRLLEKAGNTELREALAELFGLEAAPERIEVYDNSHIMGTNSIGAMIVSGAEGFIKTAYRTFNIKTASIAGGDDYGMLREVLTRRLSRLQSDDAMDAAARPDLMIIDGGAGQLSSATAVMQEMGISDIPYVCISKGVDRNAGREWFHMPGKDPFQLPPGSPVLHYLQRLRDEAHRFAIGTHRNKRSRATLRSDLDDIPGIGATRKKALLTHFGSARDVRDASIQDLSKVPGINKKTAEIIYNFFHT